MLAQSAFLLHFIIKNIFEGGNSMLIINDSKLFPFIVHPFIFYFNNCEQSFKLKYLKLN